MKQHKAGDEQRKRRAEHERVGEQRVLADKRAPNVQMGAHPEGGGGELCGLVELAHQIAFVIFCLGGRDLLGYRKFFL